MPNLKRILDPPSRRLPAWLRPGIAQFYPAHSALTSCSADVEEPGAPGSWTQVTGSRAGRGGPEGRGRGSGCRTAWCTQARAGMKTAGRGAPYLRSRLPPLATEMLPERRAGVREPATGGAGCTPREGTGTSRRGGELRLCRASPGSALGGAERWHLGLPGVHPSGQRPSCPRPRLWRNTFTSGPSTAALPLAHTRSLSCTHSHLCALPGAHTHTRGLSRSAHSLTNTRKTE